MDSAPLKDLNIKMKDNHFIDSRAEFFCACPWVLVQLVLQVRAVRTGVWGVTAEFPMNPCPGFIAM